MPRFFVSRYDIDKYCETNRINVYTLLMQLTNGTGRGFADFLIEKGYIDSVADFENSLLLHGSNNVINEFEPRVSTGGGNTNNREPLVYATDDPDYAIFLASIEIRKGGSARVDYNNGVLMCSIDSGFVNGDSKLVDGYVYVLTSSGFKTEVLHEFYINKPSIPVLALPVSSKDMSTDIVIAE